MSSSLSGPPDLAEAPFWAAGSTWGALGAAAVALTLVTTETAVLMNLPWTPWQGALWLVAALACAWATGAGRWRWWPGCVVAASISAQAHVVFALTAVGVCALSPMLALVMRSRQMRSDPVRRSEPHQAAMVASLLYKELRTPDTIGVGLSARGSIDEIYICS